MIVSISYAFPSSTMAEQFERAKEGCYYVAIKYCEGAPEDLQQCGPMDTIEEAEGLCAMLGLPFSAYSKRAA